MGARLARAFTVEHLAHVLLGTAKPDLPSGCWVWQGVTSPDGHGRVSVGGTVVYAHDVTYSVMREPIPHGLVVDHLCRNPPCVRPDHLEAVTQRQNLLRSPITQASLNAAKTTCPQGHPYDFTNTHVRKNGGRSCRTCARDRARRNTAALRTAAASARDGVVGPGMSGRR